MSSQVSLPLSIDIDCLPQYFTKVTPTEASDATIHKNYFKPLSIRTLNLVHKDDSNLPHIPPSLTPAPCKN